MVGGIVEGFWVDDTTIQSGKGCQIGDCQAEKGGRGFLTERKYAKTSDQERVSLNTGSIPWSLCIVGSRNTWAGGLKGNFLNKHLGQGFRLCSKDKLGLLHSIKQQSGMIIIPFYKDLTEGNLQDRMEEQWQGSIIGQGKLSPGY